MTAAKAVRSNTPMNDPNLFRAEFRELTFEEKQIIRALKVKALELVTFIDTQVGKGREVTLAKEHLESAVMWLTKHVSRDVE
jgi:hypothetical protein